MWRRTQILYIIMLLSLLPYRHNKPAISNRCESHSRHFCFVWWQFFSGFSRWILWQQAMQEIVSFYRFNICRLTQSVQSCPHFVNDIDISALRNWTIDSFRVECMGMLLNIRFWFTFQLNHDVIIHEWNWLLGNHTNTKTKNTHNSTIQTTWSYTEENCWGEERRARKNGIIWWCTMYHLYTLLVLCELNEQQHKRFFM